MENSKRHFLDAAGAGLATGRPATGSSGAERARAENDALKAALREATVLTWVWRVSAQVRSDQASGAYVCWSDNQQRAAG